jgi:hypothetical protein
MALRTFLTLCDAQRFLAPKVGFAQAATVMFIPLAT